MSFTLQVVAGQLPAGFCPPDYQSMLNGFSGVQTVVFPTTFSGVVTQSTPPADTTQIWLQLDSLSRPTRLYKFAQGAWLSLHTVPPGMIMIWPNALPDFTTFDGGDGNTPGPASGPMWQEFTPLRATFPVGVGTLPSTTVIPVAGTGGEENHTLITAEMPSHSHTVYNFSGGGGTGGRPTPIVPPQGDTPIATGNTGNDQPHNNLPPYLGVFFLVRTSRLYFAA